MPRAAASHGRGREGWLELRTTGLSELSHSTEDEKHHSHEKKELGANVRNGHSQEMGVQTYLLMRKPLEMMMDDG